VDWRTNTLYTNGYLPAHIVVQWFWEWLDKVDASLLLALLSFVTGALCYVYTKLRVYHPGRGSARSMLALLSFGTDILCLKAMPNLNLALSNCAN
jgi:hypothetical protein